MSLLKRHIWESRCYNETYSNYDCKKLWKRWDRKRLQKKSLPLFGISKKIYKGEVFPPESDDFVSDDNLFNYQAKVIKEVAAEESCVIIGRCADFILKDNPNVIRLFFYAPREDCITRVKTQNGGKEKDIIRKIEKTDKYRSDYYKYHTGKDWNDSRNYDFCLNTASMSYEKLVAVVKAYIEQYA